MARKYDPPLVRECASCGRVWRDSFAGAMLRRSHRHEHGCDPPPVCPACGGALGAWRAPKLSPLPVRVGRLVAGDSRAAVDRLRRRLYV